MRDLLFRHLPAQGTARRNDRIDETIVAHDLGHCAGERRHAHTVHHDRSAFLAVFADDGEDDCVRRLVTITLRALPCKLMSWSILCAQAASRPPKTHAGYCRFNARVMCRFRSNAPRRSQYSRRTNNPRAGLITSPAPTRRNKAQRSECAGITTHLRSCSAMSSACSTSMLLRISADYAPATPA